jgi:hypothetical protein
MRHVPLGECPSAGQPERFGDPTTLEQIGYPMLWNTQSSSDIANGKQFFFHETLLCLVSMQVRLFFLEVIE